jgi:arsenate reductase (thioredoxin)
MASHVMTQSERMSLHSSARDLHAEVRAIFGAETIESLLLDSYAELASKATVTSFLVIGAERCARQRLMALGWFTHLAGGRAIAWSGGSEPVAAINPGAVAAMAEVGVDISREYSKPFTDEFVLAADVVITMGCGDACPLLPGKHYEDWELDDPAGKTLEEIRPIRDEIRDRVMNLIQKLTSG